MIVVLRKGQYTAPTSILKDDLVWLTLEPWVSCLRNFRSKQALLSLLHDDYSELWFHSLEYKKLKSNLKLCNRKLDRN